MDASHHTLPPVRSPPDIEFMSSPSISPTMSDSHACWMHHLTQFAGPPVPIGSSSLRSMDGMKVRVR